MQKLKRRKLLFILAAIAIVALIFLTPFIIYRIQEHAQIAILKTCIAEKLDDGVSDDEVMQQCLIEIQKPKIARLSECAARKFKEKVPDDIANQECFHEVGITAWDLKAFDRLYDYKIGDTEDASSKPPWKQ